MEPSSASNDPEEAANIEASSDESARIEDSQQQHTDSGSRRPADATPNGHLDPGQRRVYLGLLAFSISCALTGLALLLLWMYKYRAITGLGVSNAGQLANLHPIMMYLFMVSVNLYAVLVYRTHYNQAKDRLKWAHAILSGTNMVMSLLGVFAMYKSHLMIGIPNFYSLHSWIGVLTNAFYLSQFILGFVAFLKPGLAAKHRATLMPWHRLAGATLLVMAALAAITGISELVIFQDKDGAYSKFAPITFVANFAGISTIIMTVVSIYLLTAPKWRRF